MFASMQHAQPEWKKHIGGEISDFLRRRGEAAQNATKVLQHEGRHIYELQEDRIRLRQKLSFCSPRKRRIKKVIRASKRKERQAVARLREEAHGFFLRTKAAHTEITLGSQRSKTPILSDM